MKKETLSTIAQRTGFSIATVSRVLNGTAEKYRISLATCKIVQEEAIRCHYLPSPGTQNLHPVRSHMIGLLMPTVSNAYFADMAGAVIDELNEKGYNTIVMATTENDKNMISSIKSLISRQVEGIIVVPCGDDPKDLELLSKQIPIVTMDRYFENSSLPYITTNNYQGGLTGARKLIAQGYKSIACIQGNNSMPSKERVRGFLKAVEDEGLSETCHVAGNNFSIQNGYLETKLLLHTAERPDAIFAMSNTILLGVLKAVKESGLRIPDDIAVLSFDDNIYMDYITPSIARLSQPVRDMGTLAVKILIDRIEGASTINSQILLSPTFISGESI